MPMSATLVCLNVSQIIVCINKLRLCILLVCPNLPLDTTLAKDVSIGSHWYYSPLFLCWCNFLTTKLLMVMNRNLRIYSFKSLDSVSLAQILFKYSKQHHIIRLQLVYVMGTKQHSNCVFPTGLWEFSHSILLVLLMIPLAVVGKVCVIYFLFHWLLLCESCEKINLSHPDFLDSEILIWGKTPLTNFYEQVCLLLKKGICQIAERKIFFVQIMNLKLILLSPDDIKSYY